MKASIWLAAALALNIAPALAAQKTVILAVPGMTCAACPITVKKALTRVEGVDQVEVDYARRQASVRFDDARTDTEKLIRATAGAGYPSTVKGGAK
jgi:mercuric ion binding protein